MLRQPRDGPGGNERVADGKRRDEEGTRAGFSCRLSLLGPGRSPPRRGSAIAGPRSPWSSAEAAPSPGSRGCGGKPTDCQRFSFIGFLTECEF